MSKVVVIGGGAAGMIAAIYAARNGHQVDLLEKNEKLGKKIFITGKGRCNLTNSCEPETFFDSICTNSKFLYSAYYTHTAEEVMDFFQSQGCPVKTERGQRVFPVSDHSSDVIRALAEALKKSGVAVHLFSEVQKIHLENGHVTGVTYQIKENFNKKNEYADARHIRKMSLMADAVVVATGGLSYPSTGSTGDGYVFAEEAGHSIKKTVPSLVPLEVKESDITSLQGLSLKNVSIKLKQGSRTLYESFGEMLFTHFGVSGPLILTASSKLPKKLNNEDGTGKQEEIKIFLNMKPALTEEQFDKRVIRELETNRNKEIKNVMPSILPQKLVPPVLNRAGIDPYKKVNEITREERKHLVNIIQCFEMTVVSTRGFEEAVITKGGVTVNEINASTMESKIVKGLYFAGEVMDVDALTGGFNLQIAWATGMLAGESIP